MRREGVARVKRRMGIMPLEIKRRIKLKYHQGTQKELLRKKSAYVHRAGIAMCLIIDKWNKKRGLGSRDVPVSVSGQEGVEDCTRLYDG